MSRIQRQGRAVSAVVGKNPLRELGPNSGRGTRALILWEGSLITAAQLGITSRGGRPAGEAAHALHMLSDGPLKR